jgi:Carboxypeptidase regulatory-like domain
MKTSSLLRFSVVALALACSCVALGQNVANRYRITGTVVSSTDGTPVRHCHLTATLNGHGRSGGNRRSSGNQSTQQSFDADEHGRFSVALPSAGAWSLSASARGFVTQSYDEHEQFSSAIVLTPEVPAIDLNFQLPPEAVVTGTVLDEAGEPVRNARLSLMTVPQQGPDLQPAPIAMRAMTQTDDRGIYEFANIAPGDYRISLQAQPWYAAAAAQRRVGPAPTDTPQLDPSLDVAYAMTWFPGVDDPSLAETLTLHGGDSRQADFNLVAIPSIHLRVVSAAAEQANGRPNQMFPVVTRITPGVNNLGFMPVALTTDGQGEMDIGGLTPGLYQIRMQGPGPDNKMSLVEVSAGSTRTLEIGGTADVANISLHFDGPADIQPDENSVQVQLVNTETGDVVSSANAGIGPPNPRQRRETGGSEPDRVIQTLPGSYEVLLRSRQDIYLKGITMPSAEVKGRIVKVHAGDATMTLHTASGRAIVSGMATLAGKPAVGAMVLLVPATLGNPNGLTILRRDQTNTDGSFEMSDVIPGQYILTAIDHGWNINWKDPSTLRTYLLHGTPVDLAPSAAAKHKVEAQAP